MLLVSGVDAVAWNNATGSSVYIEDGRMLEQWLGADVTVVDSEYFLLLQVKGKAVLCWMRSKRRQLG
jgi:hypothetical protein